MRSPDSRTLGNAPPARHELGRRREEPVGRTMAPLSRDLGLGSGGVDSAARAWPRGALRRRGQRREAGGQGGRSEEGWGLIEPSLHLGFDATHTY